MPDFETVELEDEIAAIRLPVGDERHWLVICDNTSLRPRFYPSLQYAREAVKSLKQGNIRDVIRRSSAPAMLVVVIGWLDDNVQVLRITCDPLTRFFVRRRGRIISPPLSSADHAFDVAEQEISGYIGGFGPR